MSSPLETHLTNHDKIRSIIQHVPVTLVLTDLRRVDTLLSYLPIKNNCTVIDELFAIIKDEILFKFAFSSSETTKKTKTNKKENIDLLFSKAVRKLSKHTAQGELGELLLFTLLEVYYNAPKILSKISLKTSRKMPVYGSDAIHGQYINGTFFLYMGESKLHKDFKPAATAAVKSIETASTKYQDEFDLLDSHLDFPNISTEIEEQLLDLLDPLTSTDNQVQINYPCFIGFSNPHFPIPSDNNNLIDEYVKHSHQHISHFFKEVENVGMSIDKTCLLLLPFTSINDIVEGFIEYMGIEE